jgi:hypothetical protein
LKIQSDLKRLAEWSKANALVLNVGKCKSITFLRLGMRSNQFKQSRSWKNEKSWTCWKFWKKKSLIFSLWAHQMKLIEDYIVFIKIFCCSKLKNCSLSSLSKSNFQTIWTVWLFEWFETGLISSLLKTTSSYWIFPHVGWYHPWSCWLYQWLGSNKDVFYWAYC